MFGFFGKKKEQKKEESPEYMALVARWDDFLTKIMTRFEESLGQAEEAVVNSLVDSDYDLHGSQLAWSGIRAQLMGMAEKINDTFNDKVKPEMLEYLEEWDLIDEDQKGVRVQAVIYHRVRHFEMTLEGKVAELFYAHAVELLDEEFNCTQCGAKIELAKDIYRSQYISCSYCNTVNTVIVSDKIASIKEIKNDIVASKAADEWLARELAEEACQGIRISDTDEGQAELAAGWKKWEVAERAFHVKYLKEKAKLFSDAYENLEQELDRYMAPFYEKRKRSLGY